MYRMTMKGEVYGKFEFEELGRVGKDFAVTYGLDGDALMVHVESIGARHYHVNDHPNLVIS